MASTAHYSLQHLDNIFDTEYLQTTDEMLFTALQEMDVNGAVSIPLLKPEIAHHLANEVRKLDFQPGIPKVGNGETAVYQDFKIALNFDIKTDLDLFTSAFERQLNRALSRFTEAPCPVPLYFNDRAAQVYNANSTGISPHRDLVMFEGIIAIITLEGQADFCICDDRQKTNSRIYLAQPGQMILMRGMNFNGNPERPFHYVENIPYERVGFGLRFNAKL